MTDPSPTTYEQPPTEAGEEEQQTPPFAPIYTLVNNASTRTTHHPRVHYIFNDDDPDLLTQALARQHDANLNESSSSPAPNHRAVLLDLAPDDQGGYKVSWASSLSPSWAVVDAQLSRIAQPSSDGEGGNDESDETSNKNKKGSPDRLMLRIEGIESGAMGSEVELKLSDEKTSGQGSDSGSGSGSKDRDRGEGEDYGTLVDEFEKRMSMLSKVVDAGEERRRKLAVEAAGEDGCLATYRDGTGSASAHGEDLRRYAEDG